MFIPGTSVGGKTSIQSWSSFEPSIACVGEKVSPFVRLYGTFWIDIDIVKECEQS